MGTPGESQGALLELGVPVYEYECKTCRHRFDLRQGFDSDPVADCPQCGGLAGRRISLVPVIFKGSGWYVTDYSRRNSTLSDDSQDGGGSSESKSRDSNGEAKSEGTTAGASKEE